MGTLDLYPDPDSQFESGSRRAKMTHKHRKKLINLIFKCWMFSFENNSEYELDPDPDSFEMLDPNQYPDPDSNESGSTDLAASVHIIWKHIYLGSTFRIPSHFEYLEPKQT
jgi:hypothetical protein